MNGDTAATDPTAERLTTIVGGDLLAVRVVAERMARAGESVVLVWYDDPDLRARVRALGARFAPLGGDHRETLVRAGIAAAHTIVALSDDDHVNLQIILLARDLNPRIRVVLRQFNRTLGRKIEQNLPDCSVVSMSSQSAATYAGAAVDPSCFYGVQFPDIDGPLLGFSLRPAHALDAAGATASEVEARCGLRVVACDGDANFDRANRFGPDDALVVFGCVRGPAVRRARPGFARPRRTVARGRRRARSLDPVARRMVLAALAVFVLGAAYFHVALGLNPLRAAYFVMTTMTTTGYGDVVPDAGAGELVAMSLMAAGVIFTGIFIASLTARFTKAQYVAIQGLRRITRRGHVIVCGAGNVGSRVVEFLLDLGCDVVVVEAAPKSEIVESSRHRGFDLLTGDATKDATLDLCNVGEAAALIALTNSDTMNLEVALGARARNATMPVVLRVQHEVFESSVRRHFGFYRTYGTAALAGPVLAGLVESGGMRGRIALGDADFEIVEYAAGAHVAPEAIALGVARGRGFLPLDTLARAEPGEAVLALVRAPASARDARARARAASHGLV